MLELLCVCYTTDRVVRNVGEFDRCQGIYQTNLLGENCLLLALCLGLHKCSVDCYGLCVACFKDIASFLITVNILHDTYSVLMALEITCACNSECNMGRSGTNSNGNAREFHNAWIVVSSHPVLEFFALAKVNLQLMIGVIQVASCTTDLK